MKSRSVSRFVGSLGLVFVASAGAADWPMWRCDAGRTGETAAEVPAPLRLAWVRELPALKPAFENPRLQFDRGYEPVVRGKTLLIASSANDSLTAFDTETGRESWRFYADGPLRLAPVAWRDRVYVGSDDGCLYCLKIADGALVWKFRAVPSDRKVLGNGRVISLWPVRGGPVLRDGRLYFAAGVWPFEGVFVYALDEDTGRVLWRNDRAGYLYGVLPHKATAIGGVTPQGYLVIDGDDLVVPCGTGLPAIFELATGKLKSFQLPQDGRVPGGWFAAMTREQRRGVELAPRRLTFDRGINTDRHEDDTRVGPGQPDVRGRIVAANRPFLFREGFPGVTGEIHSMLTADGKLFIVGRDGRVYCFAGGAGEPVRHGAAPVLPPAANDLAVGRAQRIIAATGQRRGQALVLGAGDEAFVEELIRGSEFQVVVLESDAAVARARRERWDRAGWYGTRVAMLVVDPLRAGLPPYFANLLVVPQADGLVNAKVTRAQLAGLLQAVRPYGGAAWLEVAAEKADGLRVACEQAAVPGVSAVADGSVVRLRRGPLPGATNYTTPWQSSADELVRAPLGVLWYDDDVGFFKRSPQPMLVDGVMRVYDKLWTGYPQGDRPPYKLDPTPTYMDVYTGRVLAAEEIASAAPRFPPFDPQQKQTNQYRPPTQRDEWSPAPPRPGERTNPLTGQTEPRTFVKSYGCDGGFDYGHVYTMRSGTAAFYDKRVESGTVHISGPRSGCTNSIIPACGLLNLPYYYKGCTCSYPLPTSAALRSMPATYEQWSSWGSAEAEPLRDIQRVGINFGAPGDRMTPAGTLWLDVPSVGGPSPQVDLRLEPEALESFYQHSLFLRGGCGWPWVGASGVEGLSRATLTGLRPGRYVVRLYFAEPADVPAGTRVFDVFVQGTCVLSEFDVVRAAGGSLRVFVKQLDDVACSGSLEIRLAPRAGRPVLSGVEVVATGLPLDELPRLAEQ